MKRWHIFIATLAIVISILAIYIVAIKKPDKIIKGEITGIEVYKSLAYDTTLSDFLGSTRYDFNMSESDVRDVFIHKNNYKTIIIEFKLNNNTKLTAHEMGNLSFILPKDNKYNLKLWHDYNIFDGDVIDFVPNYKINKGIYINALIKTNNAPDKAIESYLKSTKIVFYYKQDYFGFKVKNSSTISCRQNTTYKIMPN